MSEVDPLQTAQVKYVWIYSIVFSVLLTCVGVLLMHSLNNLEQRNEKLELRIERAEGKLDDALGRIRYNEARIERIQEQLKDIFGAPTERDKNNLRLYPR